MNYLHDKSPRQRVLLLLIMLIENPYRFTKKALALKFNVTKDTIKNDFWEIENAGFSYLHDSKFRYALAENALIDKLKSGLLLTEKELGDLNAVIEKANWPENSKTILIEKLDKINQYIQLTNAIFTKVHLQKVNQLENAIKDKQKVKLINYYSTNSKIKKNRIVEVFHISAEADLVNAFDPEHNEVRHFKISRIERVVQLDEDWENEGKHFIKNSDIFGIVNKERVKLRVALNVAGYNALMERFPLAKQYLYSSPSQQNIFELSCEVNAGFLGISSFLLGNFEHIFKIYEPSELITHLNEKIKLMKF